MRTSVPGHPERRLRPACGHDCDGVRGRGATLVELLLVLLVAALFAGLSLTVWRSAGDDDARGEAVRLAQLLRLAHDEARLSGVGLRWRSDGGGYGFARIDGTGDWKAIGTAEPLRTRRLAQGVRVVALRVDGHPVAVATPVEFAGAWPPRLEVELADAAARWRVSTGADGGVAGPFDVPR